MTSEPTLYEAVGGSVLGRAHAHAGRNNQDAFAWRLEGERAIAVVCDGCSAGARSEVGAALGARLAIEVLGRALDEEPELRRPQELLERTRRELLAGLRALTAAIGGDPRRTVADYLLFTLVAAVVGRERAVVLAAGDGLVSLNGERLVLGPFPENAPPYLGYQLLEEETSLAAGPYLLPVLELPSAELETLLLGTDGALGLELAPFLEGRSFRNPDAVRRRLVIEAREPNLLFDDTTLVVLRRRAGLAPSEVSPKTSACACCGERYRRPCGVAPPRSSESTWSSALLAWPRSRSPRHGACACSGAS